MIRIPEKIEQWTELAFKALFFLYVGLGSCSLTYGRSVISWVMYAAFLLGGVVLLMRLLSPGRYFRMPLLLCGVLMWLSCAVAAAANMSYFTTRTAVILILWAFYFFILYAQPGDRDGGRLLREFRGLSLVYLAWATVLALISVGMLAARYEVHYRDPANGMYEVAVGFFSGRLWGAFQDPNLGSVMCVAGIAVCVYWIMEKKSAALRTALGADIALFVFYMACSDSRNGMVCLGVLSALGMLWLMVKNRDKVNPLLAAIVVIAGFACGMLLAQLVQELFNSLMEITGGPLINRGYSMEGDISNRRLAIWRSGLELGLTRPVTGISFPAVVAYAKEHLPDTYIISNDLWEFNTFDSEPVNIFVAQGIPGVLILAAWILGAVWIFFKNIAAASAGRDRELFLLTAICCIMAVSALFQGTMFYQTSPNTFMFWCAFGTLLCLLKSAERKAGEDNEEVRPI